MEKGTRHRADLAALVLPSALFAIVALFIAAAFWPAVKASFVDLDDQPYVFANPQVLGGLTPQSVVWALTSHDNGLYIPATRMSLLLDGTISRLLWNDADLSRRTSPLPNATVYHVTNILLHVAAAWMLFLFLHRATRERCRRQRPAASPALRDARHAPASDGDTSSVQPFRRCRD